MWVFSPVIADPVWPLSRPTCWCLRRVKATTARRNEETAIRTSVSAALPSPDRNPGQQLASCPQQEFERAAASILRYSFVRGSETDCQMQALQKRNNICCRTRPLAAGCFRSRCRSRSSTARCAHPCTMLHRTLLALSSCPEAERLKLKRSCRMWSTTSSLLLPMLPWSSSQRAERNSDEWMIYVFT